jgi:RNA polymerase sigma-32 factor
MARQKKKAPAKKTSSKLARLAARSVKKNRAEKKAKSSSRDVPRKTAAAARGSSPAAAPPARATAPKRVKAEIVSPAKLPAVIKSNTRQLVVRPSTSVVPLDPLDIYLRQVSRYPLISREEEGTLVEQLRKTGDIEAAKKLVQSNLRLVVKIAMEYRSSYHNVLDLIQEGNIGLMKAVSLYDPEKGARLSYYASWWIRSYILKHILDNFRLVKMGTTQAQRKLFYNLMREKEKIEALGYYAGARLLSERLGVSEKAVIEMDRRLSEPELSLDSPMSTESGSDRYIDYLPGEGGQRPDTQVEQHEVENILHKVLEAFSGKLNDRDKVIFQERLLSEVPKTLEELANRYSISKERARQLEANILTKLRKFFEEHRIDSSVIP